MYRPEGWENPYSSKPIEELSQADYCLYEKDFAFEAGADAMLEGLKGYDNSIYIAEEGVDGQITLPRPLIKGWLVFIPEENK